MTFFLDENFPKSAVNLLIESGHTVIDIRGTGNEGLNDVDIFALCQKNKAVFLTTDRDFFHTIHFTSQPHFGIVVIALSKPNAGNITEKVEWMLETDLLYTIENRCLVIMDIKYSIYK